MGHEHCFEMVLEAIQKVECRAARVCLSERCYFPKGIARAKREYEIEVGLICIAVGVMVWAH